MLALNQTFDFNGQKVAWGKMGQGYPLVLVHGLPWSAQAWRNIAPWLARERTVYFYDMIGCGQSEKFEGQDVSEASQNELLTQLVNYWALDRPDIVGHDFGGLATLRSIFINKLQYRKVFLIDAVAVLPSGSPFFLHMAKHAETFATLPAYAHEALFRAYIQNAAQKLLSAEAIELYLQPWVGDIGQPAYYRQIVQANNDNIAQAQALYGPINSEVHLIWGEQDTFIPLDQGRQLAGLISADSFTVVPDAAHIVQEDAPQAIVSVLLSH